MNGTGAWHPDATWTVSGLSVNSFNIVWSNNGVNLAAGSTYCVGFQVVGMV